MAFGKNGAHMAEPQVPGVRGAGGGAGAGGALALRFAPNSDEGRRMPARRMQRFHVIGNESEAEGKGVQRTALGMV